MTEAPKKIGYSDAVIESAARAGYEAVNARSIAEYIRIGRENFGSVTPMETIPWAEQGPDEKKRNIDNARILAEDRDTKKECERMIRESGTQEAFDLFCDVVDAVLSAEDRRVEKLFTPSEEETAVPRKKSKPVVPSAVVTAFMSGLGRGLGQGIMEALAASGAEKPVDTGAADGPKPKCEHVFHGSGAHRYLPCPGCGEVKR